MVVYPAGILAVDGRNLRETSLDAFNGLRDKKSRQEVVYRAIEKLNAKGEFPTDRETARYLNYTDPNAVRPRRNELAKAGRIVEAGVKICSVSKKKALAWRIKP